MVTFARGVTSIQLPNPRRPYTPKDPPRQVTTVSGGGVMRTTQFGVPDKVLVLRFLRLTNAEYTNLKSFIVDTLVYRGYSFTFTDHEGTDHTSMHYVEGIDTKEQDRGGRWNITLTIKKNLGS